MSSTNSDLSTEKGVTAVGKSIGTFILTIFFFVGIAIASLLGRDAWSILQTHDWPAHPCVIVRSEVFNETEKHRSDPYTLKVEYRYEIGGQTYTSARHSRERVSSSDWNKIHNLAQLYPAGENALCYVNPDNPSQAILQPEDLWFASFIIIPLIFIGIAIAGIRGIWLPKKPSPTTSFTQPPKSSGGWFGYIFFGIFALAGILGTFALSRNVVDFLSASSWVETPCTVESSRVLTHHGKNSRTYSVDVLYRYSVNGQEFRSNRYSFANGSSGSYQPKQDVVKKLPPGRKTVCFVDPADPARAVLNRDWTREMLVILVPLLFACIGLGGLLFLASSGNSVSRQED